MLKMLLKITENFTRDWAGQKPQSQRHHISRYILQGKNPKF